MPDRFLALLSDTSLLLLYIIAAIAGGLGGCGAAAFYATHNASVRMIFVVAYIMLGMVFGIIALAVAATWEFTPNVSTLHELILYAVLSGAAGSLALVSANATIMILLRRLGIELQITIRKPGEDRRNPTRPIGQ